MGSHMWKGQISGAWTKGDRNTEMDATGAEAFVLAYLTKHGHIEAAAMIKSKSSGNGNGGGMKRAADGTEAPGNANNGGPAVPATMEELVLEGLKDGEAGAYILEYDRFRTWAMGSFDDVKSEFLAVSFPLYVHSYINLIKRGASAAQVLYFWKLFNADHADTYYDEIMQLGLLTTQSQLHELVAGVREADGGASGVPSAGGGGGGGGGGGSGTRVSDLELAHSPLGFVKLALRGKFRVEMTVMGQKILMKHLYENELLLLTSVVAERVSFFVHHGEPSGLVGTADLTGWAAPTKDDARITRVHWTAPGVVSARVPFQTLEHGQDPKSSIETSIHNAESGLFCDMITKLVVPKLHRHEVLLPGRGVAAEAPPSVMFSTLVNTYDTATCLAMDVGATVAVAGFRDGVARVWALGGGGVAQGGGQGQGRGQLAASSSSSSSSSSSAAGRAAQSDSHDNDGNGSDSGSGSGSGSGPGASFSLVGHSKAIFGVDVDASGRLALTCAGDETVRLWDTGYGLRDPAGVGGMRDPHCLAKYVLPKQTFPWCVRMCPIGHYFAVGGSDCNAALFSTDRSERLRVFGGHVSDVNAVAWHPNALSVFTASADRSCRMWDIRSGRSARWLRGPSAALCSTAVSSDGSLLAAGSETGAVTVWDVPSGRRLATLEGHQGPVHSLTFRQSRSVLCTGGADCTIRTWDLARAATTYNSDTQLAASACYYTKQSPVYFVGCTTQDLLLGGGPYSLGAGGERYVKELSTEHKVASLGISVIPPPPNN